ncbi:hypothetical protein, partial [Klebsiella pneumoniae]|uniref:hypothetical protein n=1 Tax=Klebsiella pneumoniae TaxID=573 RepID=UPI003019D475
VRVAGKPATVTDLKGRPGVRLPRGRYEVTGSFNWDALPPVLQIPTETGLIALTVGGRAVQFPVRDEQGRVWLQKRAGEEEG